MIILDLLKKYGQDIHPCINGLDADLIMLAFCSHLKNITLFRESQLIDRKLDEGFKYIHINTIKNYIVDEFIERLPSHKKYDHDRLIDDFVFLCFLLGNDFVPSIPSLRIRENGVVELIKRYCYLWSTFRNYLVNVDMNFYINIEFLQRIFIVLGGFEDSILDRYTKKDYNPRYSHEYSGYSKLEKAIYEYENIIPRPDDILRLGDEGYKERYYSHYFFINYLENKDKVSKICLQYLRGLQWILIYYFKGPIDWRWFYEYPVAPFITDLAKYGNFNILKTTKHFRLKTGPLTPEEQLLLVLPPHSSEFLPKEYQPLVSDLSSPILDLYPMDFKIDYYNKDAYWKGIPILPALEYKRVLRCCRSISLSSISK